ncbi:MAG: hypothetical protein FWD53_12195, partial [Phycisphaerales bacterium]|nr:hypothetical protein [Phycisphaerales bacterium]
MAVQPTVYFWQIPRTSSGAINNFSTGGINGTSLSSAPLDFANVQAGFYTPPVVLLIEFRNGGVAADIDLVLYDTDTSSSGGYSSDPANQIVTSQGENIFSGYPNSWRFRVDCRQTFQDPADTNLFNTDPANSPMNYWHELRWGA